MNLSNPKAQTEESESKPGPLFPFDSIEDYNGYAMFVWNRGTVIFEDH